jgi:hypothetical protein
VLVKKCFAKNATRWSIVESVMSISVSITIALSIVKLVIYVIVDLVDVTRDAVYMEWRVTRTTFVSQRSLPPSGRNSCSTNERITTYANI